MTEDELEWQQVTAESEQPVLPEDSGDMLPGTVAMTQLPGQSPYTEQQYGRTASTCVAPTLLGCLRQVLALLCLGLESHKWARHSHCST